MEPHTRDAEIKAVEADKKERSDRMEWEEKVRHILQHIGVEYIRL